MNTESVKSLFTLFSGEECADRYAPAIALAIRETESMLLPEADSSDVRLEFLCAAIADYHVQLIKHSQDRRNVTYAGKYLSGGSGSTALAGAERLVREHMELCRELISPQGFVFRSFSGEEEI
ncbi:MAG: hypothetical protein IJ874_07485 [Ruminococcus sp.]|nr:hypothetical protein [Ruminococcus sp.]